MLDVLIRASVTDLQRYAGGLNGKVGTVVKRTAFAVERDAKVNANVDTGAMRASVYTALSPDLGGSGYSGAAAAAAAANPGAEAFPAHDAPAPLSAVVACAVEYGVYVDQGTVTQAGSGWWTRAVEGQREPFQRAMTEAVRP